MDTSGELMFALLNQMVVSKWIVSVDTLWNMIEGEKLYLFMWASTGKAISGTILIHQTSCHVYKDAGTGTCAGQYSTFDEK